MRPSRLVLLSCSTLLAACGGPTEVEPQGDPCAPHGHIHRESSGDWCHCDRGHVASASGLACEPDPAYVPREGFDFGDNGEHACWHVSHGPYATATASEERQPRVDAFHTFYTLKLRPEAGQYVGTFQFKAYATGDFIAYLSDAAVPFIVHEPGKGDIAPLASAPIPAPLRDGVCGGGLVHMHGYELTDKVTYTFTVGPTPLSQLSLVVEHL